MLVTLLAGLIAAWLSGQPVRGAGFGLAGDIGIGIIGELILPRLGLRPGVGMISAIVNVTSARRSC